MSFSVSYIYEIQDKYTKKLIKINSQTKKFRENVKLTQRKMRGLSSTLTNLEHKMFAVSSRGQTLFPTHRVHDYKRAIDKTNTAIGRTNRTLDRTHTKVSKVHSKMSKFKGMGGMGGAVSGFALGAGTLFPVAKSMKFESAMADVRKVIREITPKQLVDLRQQIKDSAIEMARLPAQTARIAEAAGKLNIPVNQMGQFISLISRSAVAFDVLESTIGTDVGRIKTRLKLTIDETGSLMDSINFLADNTSAQGDRMINIIGRISGVMNTIQMPPDLVAGWGAFADQIEVTPMLAASGFRMVVTKMKKMPGMMEHLLKAPSETIIKFLKQFEKIEPAKRAVVLLKVFGDEAGKFAEKAVNNLALLDRTLALVSDNSGAAGSTMRELQWKMGTALFQTKKVWSALIVTFIDVGNNLLPLIKEVSPSIVKISAAVDGFVKRHPELTKNLLLMGLIVSALMSAIVALGMFAAAFAFLLPVLGFVGTALGFLLTAFGSLSSFIVIVGGIAAIAGGPLLWALGALVVLVVILHKKFGLLNAPVEMFKNTLESIKDLIQSITQSTFGEALIRTGDVLKGLTLKNLMMELVTQKELATTGSLNGEIRLSASHGTNIEQADLFTSQPGNLGFNMGGSH